MFRKIKDLFLEFLFFNSSMKALKKYVGGDKK